MDENQRERKKIRLKDGEREEAEERIKEKVITLLSENRNKKFTFQRIAELIELNVEPVRHRELKEKRNVWSPSENERMLTKVLRELEEKRLIKKGYDENKQVVYWRD